MLKSDQALLSLNWAELLKQVITQILNRRMIYASEATDITEQLIVRINNLSP